MRPAILSFFLFFAQFCVAGAAQTLDVVRDQNTDSFWILGSVNDNADHVFFLVDTGASRTTFSLETAKKYGIEVGNCEAVLQTTTPAGLNGLCQKTVEKLEVGGFIFNNVKIYILQNLAAAPALLGNDLLRKFLIFQHGENGQILTLSR